MLQLLWFKRDLRLHDHAPLAAAAAAGRVLPVYVHEPELLHADDHDPRHAAFVHECLQELRDALNERGVPLLELHGTLQDVFEALCEQLPIVPHEASYAHARDTLHALKQSAQQQGVSRRVWQQHGSRRTPLNAPTR